LIRWIAAIIYNNIQNIEKRVRHRGVKLEEALYNILSGINISIDNILDALEAVEIRDVRPLLKDNKLIDFSRELLEISKPIIISGNKIDKPRAEENYRRLKTQNIDVIPTSALSEYILKRLAREGIIYYRPGDKDFDLLKPNKIDDKLHRTLEMIREKILRKWGGTGVQKILNTLVYEKLGYIAVYPVKDPNKYADTKGRILPDIYLLKEGSTIKDLANMIHSDLASRVKYGVDAITKRRISLNYKLKHRDIISISIY
ncbi:TPA: TGS domain-containing protein, partial [Candidatus Geothermarchaeota archaeon]|nr:TGS domain-containing protein [Candidatus Geothermarchaeota archaeon]